MADSGRHGVADGNVIRREEIGLQRFTARTSGAGGMGSFAYHLQTLGISAAYRFIRKNERKFHLVSSDGLQRV